MSGLLFSRLRGRADQKPGAMWMLVGLGNPGARYEKNRHNIGFMVLDRIAESCGFPDFRRKYQGLLSEATLAGTKILLLKPQTYMNLSGGSVQQAAKFYKIRPEKIIVFHDEIDLKPGDVRVKLGGGNAGHNGLKSMQESLGTSDFWRVRIGVGRPAHGEVSDYVLGNFTKEEEAARDVLIEKLVNNVELLLKDPKEYEKKILGK